MLSNETCDFQERSVDVPTPKLPQVPTEAGRARRSSRSGSSAASRSAALDAAQKNSHGTPLYSRLVNRRLGRWIAGAAFKTRLQPNGITAISAAFTFSGIAAIALLRPSAWVGVLVFACLVAGYAFDAADGQLARLRGGGTLSGEWLDHMVDSAKICSLHLAVLIFMYRFSDVPSMALLVPVGFTVVASVTFFGMILNDQLRRRWETKSVKTVVRKPTSLVRSLLVVPTDYGLLCVAFILLGWPLAFFAFYTLLFAANVAFLLLAAVKWFNDMKALV